ncbi:hypothetical protein [uncultured Gimesia sp.]|uniref:hypothetical protein n=1 Tax=uncultured Gimesia sp. TaxID=1678688 RepID=UPI0030D9A82F|tara:strand:+ start:1058 stop:1498 length:441 start_codon:yes stop_codon:yes gene_type:complete
MIPDSEFITIYKILWGNKSYVFGRSEEEAYEKLTNRCPAYGDPENEDDARYMLGTKWASNSEDGWRIESQEIEVKKLHGHIYGSFAKNEIVHYYWKCPVCNDTNSGDLEEGDQFPRLVVCHHRSDDQQKTYFQIYINGQKKESGQN